MRTNQLVYDIISPEARTNDRKMHNIDTSIIKGSVILTKVVNKLAVLVKDGDDPSKSSIGKIIDECNDSLTLIGLANRSILQGKISLNPNFGLNIYIYAQSVPYTSWLFGDDISKTAKEIEGCSKICHRIQHNSRGGSFRGRMRGRCRMPGRGRIRGRGA